VLSERAHFGGPEADRVYGRRHLIVLDPDQRQTTETPYDPAISGQIMRPWSSFTLAQHGVEKVIARRAAMSGETKGRKHSEGQEQLVGVEQGESSGDDACLMRYDRNGAYVKTGQPNVRVIIQTDRNPEPVGCRICKSRTGTGINAASPGPSRYGNAAPGRGECLSKIKISDF
jgi:hypothetical protein